MCNVLKVDHGATIAVLVHDAGVQGYVTVTIGATPFSNRFVGHIGFFYHDTLFHGIQSGASAVQYFPGFGGGVAKVPSAYRNGFYDLDGRNGFGGLIFVFA
jgi:hypothetical protein